jgi:uncharacterized protein (DUF58 family)
MKVSPLNTTELSKKAKQLKLRSRQLVDEMHAGFYKTKIKGSGLQFSEHRQYVAGDDIRHIDWKVSARTKDLWVKKFEEERELNVLILLDISGSQNFGSSSQGTKLDVSKEAAILCAFAAYFAGDKVGLMLWSDEVEAHLRPQKNHFHINRVIQTILTAEAKLRKTDLKKALQSAFKVCHHRSVIFVISDFISNECQDEIKKLRRKHTVIAISVEDLFEKSSVQLKSVWIQNTEDASDQGVYFDHFKIKGYQREEVLKSFGSQVIRIETTDSVYKKLSQYFSKK